MIIAKIGNNNDIVVGDYRELFPYTSFPLGGPTPVWLADNSCMAVRRSIAHDPATEKLVDSPPYILDGDVYVVQKVTKTPEEIEASLKSQIPSAVTMRQGRLALLQFGLLDTVDSALAAIEDSIQRRAAQIEWEYATEIRRDSPLVTQLSSSLGLTEKQMDQLFLLASTL